MLSCKFCKISKNTFFTEHLRWLRLFCQTSITGILNFKLLTICFLKEIPYNMFGGALNTPLNEKCSNVSSQSSHFMSSETFVFFCVFRKYKMETLARIGQTMAGSNIHMSPISKLQLSLKVAFG